ERRKRRNPSRSPQSNSPHNSPTHRIVYVLERRCYRTFRHLPWLTIAAEFPLVTWSCETAGYSYLWLFIMLIRLSKIVMVATIAALFSVVAFGNITDYGTNYAFVQHVMSMDTLFPTTTITYRAITDPAVQSAAYALIIATECVVAALCWIGALILLFRC